MLGKVGPHSIELRSTPLPIDGGEESRAYSSWLPSSASGGGEVAPRSGDGVGEGAAQTRSRRRPAGYLATREEIGQSLPKMPGRHIHMRMMRMRFDALGLVVVGRVVRPPFAGDDDAVGDQPLVRDQ